MKNKYVYVKNMLSMDLVEYISTWHLKNYVGTKETPTKDDQVPLAFSIHSKQAEIYRHLLHHLLPIMEKETNLS